MTTKLFEIQVGRRIRALRRERNMTQKQLSVACGIHSNSLCAIERGRSSATVESLKTIAEALAVSPADLLNLDDELYETMRLHPADVVAARQAVGAMVP